MAEMEDMDGIECGAGLPDQTLRFRHIDRQYPGGRFPKEVTGGRV
jgi:hypothetical protein